MLKRSVLSDAADLIQNELDAYSQLSGLSFDVLDENMYRIAGTGYRTMFREKQHRTTSLSRNMPSARDSPS